MIRVRVGYVVGLGLDLVAWYDYGHNWLHGMTWGEIWLHCVIRVAVGYIVYWGQVWLHGMIWGQIWLHSVIGVWVGYVV